MDRAGSGKLAGDPELRKLDTQLYARHRNSPAIEAQANEKKPVPLFRGTFYRWAQLWPEVCANLRDAPKVLAVGDLHVGSFGTWCATEGPLSWGVDDFDESYPLPIQMIWCAWRPA
jgi:uncharacterized protein (DUF2252 family)